MKGFTLKFSISRTEHSVEMDIRADSFDDAQNFGDGICDNMQGKEVYSQKNDSTSVQFWNCYVEERVKPVPPPTRT